MTPLCNEWRSTCEPKSLPFCWESEGWSGLWSERFYVETSVSVLFHWFTLILPPLNQLKAFKSNEPKIIVVSPARKECNFCARYCTVLWVGLASLKAVNLLYQACLAQPECLHSSLTTGPTVTRWGETNKTKATFKIHGRCFTYFLCVSITSGQRSMPLMSWWTWLILKSWKSPSQIQSYWQLGQLFWGHIDIYHSWQKTIYYDIPPTVVFEKITCTRWIVFSVDDVGASCICCAVVCSKVRSW